ncbi:MAG: acyl-CoA thioesterase [Chloroflexota bacterium]|nr:MAG: acyl-CoA thioesterase [Chloroflexota bacterium]
MPESLRPKRIAESRSTLSALMGPQDTNSHGNVHGGVIMKLVDEAGAIAAMRHANRPVVTVAIDSMTFMEPVYVSNLVVCKAELTYVGRTSMEVRVEVVAEDPIRGTSRVVNNAYVVYVALDDSGKPTPVPPLDYETVEERQRAQQAQARQAYRKQHRAGELR